MYQTAKKAREAMKSKAKRLASDRPLQKVDSSTFRPPEMLNADVKTGLRPVSRRAYKSGGKVDGSCGPMRADRKARKSGGKTEATAYANAKVNRNVKDANEEREGIKHVGGMKRGGSAYARGGMPIKDHPYHSKSDAELRYIIKDAGEAARAMRGHSPKSEGKYLDQVNDASTVLNYRKKGGSRVTSSDSDKNDTFRHGGRAKKYNGGPMAGANRMMADASQRAGVPNAMLGFSGVKRGALSPMRATGLKKGGKADDAAQDKALVKKAMRQHETAQHGGKHSELKLRRGGYAKKQVGGGLGLAMPSLTPAEEEMLRRGKDPYEGDTTRGLTDMPKRAGKPTPSAGSVLTGAASMYRKDGGKVRKADGGGAGKSEIERVLERARAGNPDPKTRYVSYAKEERRPSKPPSALDEVDEEIADTQREAKMEEMYKAFRAKKAAAARQKAKEESARDSNVREGLSRMPMFKHGGEAKRTARSTGGSSWMDAAQKAASRKPSDEDFKHPYFGDVRQYKGLRWDESKEKWVPKNKRTNLTELQSKALDDDRSARKFGGRTGKKGKGKTNINIVIDAGGAKAPGLGAMPPLPMPGGRPVPPPMPVGGPGAGAPMGLGAGPMPPAAPPPAMPAGPMPMARKNGGRTMRRAGGKVYRSYKDMDAGAGSGLGRLEKTEIARRN